MRVVSLSAQSVKTHVQAHGLVGLFSHIEEGLILASREAQLPTTKNLYISSASNIGKLRDKALKALLGEDDESQ